jgi:hypothetical protein
VIGNFEIHNLQGGKKVHAPPAISSCALFDCNSDSTWDNRELSKLNSDNNSLEIYADKEIRRSGFVTLRKDVTGDKWTKRNKDLSSNISGRKIGDQKRYMKN